MLKKCNPYSFYKKITRRKNTSIRPFSRCSVVLHPHLNLSAKIPSQQIFTGNPALLIDNKKLVKIMRVSDVVCSEMAKTFTKRRNALPIHYRFILNEKII